MYSCNDKHSTWFEAGYTVVDFDHDSSNTAWKATLSQNICFDDAKNSDRTMIRFYTTDGDAENKVRATD
jgi:maltoporin